MTDSLASALRVGDIVAGKYRVERVLGAGAMGVVVAALHVDLGQRRALKLMQPAMAADAEGVERFLREARAVARLTTPHVAKVHDTGRLENGLPYIVMEYLEGWDLKAVLDTRERLPPQEAASYVLQACRALHEAHALGIVHRDLKPANLFLARDPAGPSIVKVLDFGIAKLVGQGDVELTQAAAMLGSPFYMSPEQMRSANSVDHRTDIWALGAILYRMVCGEVPFPGESVTEICAGVIADNPPPVRSLAPDVPPGLEAVIMRCLEKSAAKRFSSVSELGAALTRLDTYAPAAAPAEAISPAATSLPDGASPAAQGNRGTIQLPVVTANRPAAAPTAAVSAADQTARSATWSSGAPTPAPPARRRTALFVAVAGVVSLAAVGAFGARYFRSEPTAKSARSARSASTETASASAAAAIPSGPESPRPVVEPAPSASAPTASAVSSASATPPPSSSPPAATVGAPPRTAATVPPRPSLPTRPTRPNDAFGRERE